MELFLTAFIGKAAVDYPILMTIISIMGMARLFLKPIMTFVHSIIDLTETTKDNEFVAKMEASKIYKSILFVLDYVFSLKIKK